MALGLILDGSLLDDAVISHVLMIGLPISLLTAMRLRIAD